MHPVDLVEAAADGFVLEAPPREYTRRQFLTNVWKTGNLLRSLGVHEDSLVAVLDEPTPESLLSLFGASLLGARVQFDPSRTTDARVLVGPTDRLGGFELPPGGQVLGYGEKPADPTWAYFEQDVWSENPSFPEVEHDPTAPLIQTEQEQYETGTVVAAAQSAAATYDPEDRVVLRAPLAAPETVVTGVLAPVAAGATILLPGDGDTGTVAVVAEDASDVPERRTVDPSRVDLDAQRP